MDPLSDVLSLLRPSIHGASGFDMGGDWAIHFPHHQGIKCYSMISGQCWLSMDGVADALLLSAGDCFVLPRGRPFKLASDLGLPGIETSGCEPNGTIEVFEGGGGCFIAGGHFALANLHADLLIETLPPIIHIHGEASKASLRWSLDLMRDELSRQQLGAGLISEHLAHMVLIQALRIHVADGSATGRGWLFALADRQIGATIKAIHADPGHPWTLQGLARQAFMSRSGFAARFRDLVGETPMGYVTRWRMMLAGDRLAKSNDPVSVVARSLGYVSESAFSIAFKRVVGSSPRQYGRHRRPSIDLDGGSELAEIDGDSDPASIDGAEMMRSRSAPAPPPGAAERA